MIDKRIAVERIDRWLNGIEACGIVLVLTMAFGFQYLFNELPCPLCLLQRIGFTIVALGFLLNIRFGLRPSHYAIALLGALFTAFVALRQVWMVGKIPNSGVSISNN